MPEGVGREVDWQRGCAEFQRAAHLGGATGRYIAEQGRLLREIAQALPEGGRALVISHGGIVEAGAVGCLPDYDFSGWTQSAGYCEGVRLRFEGGRFVAAEPLRALRGDEGHGQRLGGSGVNRADAAGGSAHLTT